MSEWRVLRIAVIALFFILGAASSPRGPETTPFPLPVLGLFAFGGMASGIWWSLARRAEPVVISLSEQQERWYRPRWDRWQGIPDLLHLAGWAFVGAGAGLFVGGLLRSGGLVDATFVLCAGAGVIAGVRLALPRWTDNG